MTTIDATRLAQITRLNKGKHKRPEDGHCIMEVVAEITGGPFNDAPACVCPVLRRYTIRLNDRMPDEVRTALLLPYVTRLVDTAGDRAVTVRRGYIAADYACRVFAPIALDAAGMASHAERLRALAPVRNRKTVERGRTEARSAGYSAAASAAASAASAVSAAYSAAYSAAVSAADSAAVFSADSAAVSAAAHADSAASAVAHAASIASAADSNMIASWRPALDCLDAMLAVSA
jgi:hypothetical protein